MRNFYIDLDGFDGYEQWEYSTGVVISEDEMIKDVRDGLEELGGGHADIWDADTDELFAEIEV